MFALAMIMMAGTSVWAQDLDLGYTPAPGPGERPGLLVTPTRAVRELEVSCEAGGKTYTFDTGPASAGKQRTFSWDRDTKVTEAVCFVRAVFPDGYVSELNVPVSYAYEGALSVDLSTASADVEARTITVGVTARVERAEIQAFGARKVLIDERQVEVGDGPGDITIPWVGDPADVVLLDIKLHTAAAWASFTYSPWFLDIPHDDVLFPTNSDVVPAEEEHKLRRTLRDLQDVIEKYGDVVPVKLYIAGCTDTVGDAAHNRDLSRRRARAIAKWLRGNGYDLPIYFYGFGETLLAAATADGVDEPRNRRVLYMVGANPPPGGSGVPRVSWSAL